MDQFAPFLLNLRRKETSPLKALGRHLLTECYGCERTILNDVEQVKQAMEAAALRSGATILNTSSISSIPMGSVAWYTLL